MPRALPFAAVLLASLLGCGQSHPNPSLTTGTSRVIHDGKSDLEAVRSADISILFVGNSHTMNHNIPALVAEMVRFRHPEKKVVTHAVGTSFLEEAVKNQLLLDEIDTRPWKFVVLQAQKISMSGRFRYSQTEGIDLAKRAKAKGATVYYFSEWGRKDVPNDAEGNEKIYREMATAAGVEVACVGRAWDLALAERPELPLHDFDGNHQSADGAFLTACVLVGRLLKESPAPLAAFPYRDMSEADRTFLAEKAAKSLEAR